MKPPPFRYERAESAAGAVEFLADNGDRAKALAGGQGLIALMNMRITRPEALLEIGPLDELRFVIHNGAIEAGGYSPAAFGVTPLTHWPWSWKNPRTFGRIRAPMSA